MSFLRKLAPIATSALLAGMTIMSAAALDLATYPAPFVEAGRADVGIVLGASAAVVDTIAAVDVATDLQANLAGVSDGVGGIITGEGINLATSNTRLYYGSYINAARTTLTDNELPTVLADGEVADDSGNEFAYTQSIELGTSSINFSTSGGDIDDPEMLIQIGTTKGDGIYKWKVAFTKDLNISNSDVQGNTINIMGQDFTIGASSSSTIVYLYGVGTSATLKEGEEKTVTIAGNEYTISCDGVSSTTVGMITVNGQTKEITEGNIYKFGDVEIYAKNVFYLAKEAQVSSVELSIGSKRLKIENAKTVKYGSDDTTVKGTLGNVSAGSTGGTITGFEVEMSAQKSKTDHLSVGDSFVDPVFGTIKVTFKDVVPALDSAARDTIKFEAAARNVKATFTDELTGEEHSFTFAHDSDTSDSSVTKRFSDSSNYTIHNIEGENISVDEYFIINAGDYGRIIKVEDLPDAGDMTSTESIDLSDALSGETWTLQIGSNYGRTSNRTFTVDGQTYYLSFWNASRVLQVTWGTNAGYSQFRTLTADGPLSTGVDYGNDIVVFPRIKLQKGEWISFLYNSWSAKSGFDPLNLTNGTAIKLPGLYAKAEDITADTLPAKTNGSGDGLYGIKEGAINWSFNSTVPTNAGSASYYLTGINSDDDNAWECDFTDTPAVLLLEEYQADGTAYVDAICIPIDNSGTTTPVEISVGTPIFLTYDASKGIPSLASLTSDTYKQEAVSRFGTWIQYDSTENDAVTILYPDEQMYADVYIAEEAAAITGTAVGVAGGALGSVTVTDAEVSSVEGKNLVVFGGSAINSVAANLLGLTYPTYGDDDAWVTATGVTTDMALIKLFDSPYTDGKVAMLIAGYEGKDTRAAARAIVTGTPALSGESVVLSTVSESTVEITEPATVAGEGEAEAEEEEAAEAEAESESE